MVRLRLLGYVMVMLWLGLVSADDLKIYMKIQACNSSLLFSNVAIFQQDIDVLNGVAKSWGLFLHPDK